MRLDDLRDQRAERPTLARRDRGHVPGAMADGTQVQAMEIAGTDRGPDGLDRDATARAALVATLGDAGATLAVAGLRVGGSPMQPPQGLRDDPRSRDPPGDDAGRARRAHGGERADSPDPPEARPTR